MNKKISWLDSFAEEQAAKLQKTASLNKKAAQIIVNCGDVPGATNGQQITYKNEKYTVVDAAFNDEAGAGIVLERLAEGEEEMGGEEVTAGFEDFIKDKKDEKEEGVEDSVPAEGEEEVKEEVPATDAPATDAPVTDAPVAPATDAPVAPGVAPVAPANGNVSGQPIGTQQKVTDSAEFARVDPGSVYDIGDVRDQVEPAKFNGEAAETAQNIAQENSVDRSVMENRTPNRIFNRMMNDFQTQAPATEEAPVEEDLQELDLPDEEVPATEAPAVEEAPVVEEDAPAVEEDAPEVEEEVEEKKEDKFAKNKILRKILSGK